MIHQNREIIRLLIEYGADLRALNRFGRSPLQIAFERDPGLGAWLFRQLRDPTVLDAAEAGALDDLRKLVYAGADVNMVSLDRRRVSPLQAAALRGDVEIVGFLLEQGANVNYRGAWGRPAVVIAATSAYSAEMTELLLSRGSDPDATDGNGNTALYDVAATCSFDVLETLIRAGADVNFRAPDGSTRLHQAGRRNSDVEARAIHTLVQHGAKLDAQDNQGLTPLHAALEGTMADAARALLDLGADPTIRDRVARSAGDIEPGLTGLIPEQILSAPLASFAIAAMRRTARKSKTATGRLRFLRNESNKAYSRRRVRLTVEAIEHRLVLTPTLRLPPPRAAITMAEFAPTSIGRQAVCAFTPITK